MLIYNVNPNKIPTCGLLSSKNCNIVLKSMQPTLFTGFFFSMCRLLLTEQMLLKNPFGTPVEESKWRKQWNENYGRGNWDNTEKNLTSKLIDQPQTSHGLTDKFERQDSGSGERDNCMRGDPYTLALTQLELWGKNYSYLIFPYSPLGD